MKELQKKLAEESRQSFAKQDSAVMSSKLKMKASKPKGSMLVTVEFYD